MLEQAKCYLSADLAIITLDAEKAFNSVQLPWMFLVMRKIGVKISKLPTYIRSNIMYRDTVIAWRETLRLLGKLMFFRKYALIQGNSMYPQGAD